MAWALLLACRPPIGLDRAGPSVGDTADRAMDCEGAGTCAVPTTAESRIGHHDVAVADDGSVWLSWVETHELQATTVWIARSPKAGAPLGDPTAVPVIEPPVVGSSEKPSLALRGDRVVFGYTGTGLLRHGDAHAVYVQHGRITHGEVTFEPALQVDLSTQRNWVAEQARVALTDDGAWLLYKRQNYGERDIATVARESEGYVPTGLSEALSQDHECSPPDLVAGEKGAVYVALRSNVDGLLQTVVVRADDPTVAPVTVTHDDWVYSDLVCPDDGPRLAELSDGRVAVAWTAPTEDTWRMSWATSDDGGESFGDPELHHGSTERGDRFPVLVAAPDGGVLSAVHDLGGGSRLFARSASLGEPEERPLVAPNGQPLEKVELAIGGGRVVAAGLDEDGRLWLVEVGDA
ncbi:MAG: hypothetical protein KTR31_06780 [Myxococcales bacterium]|nr:hypothetical protein [Myxococcales bacterium]